jgi:hypothetical protein
LGSRRTISLDACWLRAVGEFARKDKISRHIVVQREKPKDTKEEPKQSSQEEKSFNADHG